MVAYQGAVNFSSHVVEIVLCLQVKVLSVVSATLFGIYCDIAC